MKIVVFAVACAVVVNAFGAALSSTPVWEYVTRLTTNADGGPNPRVACTLGNFYARSFLNSTMGQIGLQPLLGSKSFINEVDQSTDAAMCNHGIANVIGYVKGTEKPDSYIVYSAHYDGPNNQGPTQKELGNQGTSNIYDDATGVAIGLAVAKILVGNPPKISVIFFFDDAEEGFSNVGTPEIGETTLIDCVNGPIPDFVKRVENLVQPTKATACGDKNGQYPVGMASWLAKPTISTSNIKFVISADPLGALTLPGPHGQLLVAIGSETSVGTQELVTQHLPAQNSMGDLNLGFVPINGILQNNYATSNLFNPLRVPNVWFAQPSFAKYHGGLAVNDTIRNFGSAPAFFALDEDRNADRKAIEGAYEFMLKFMSGVANDVEGLESLSYNHEPAGTQYTCKDVTNSLALAAKIKAMVTSGPVTGLPDPSAHLLTQTVDDIVGQLEQFGCSSGGEVPTDAESQRNLLLLSTYLAGAGKVSSMYSPKAQADAKPFPTN